ncbi:MAG: hypothetical protein APF81_11670 [Desulfosporosinus sp. BRH_c37]|nr:MAG: hypothetical protein APF81_11670 [Desulfosporosinus sp. BRH_c37]
MKKKLAAGVLSLVLLVGGATAAFGATDPDKLAEIKALTQQVFGLQKEIVDKTVAAGLRTSEQGDAMKKFIDQRQQFSDQALAEGKVFEPGMGGKSKGIRRDAKVFNNGEPMTADQIKAWSEQAQARLTAQVEAMKSNGKLTEDQIKTWSDAAQAQLKVQAEAMANGTFVPGFMGKGISGGKGCGVFGGTLAPTTSATTSTAVTQ